MTRLASTLIAVLGYASASSATARDPAVVTQEAKDVLAAELAECAAYYNVVVGVAEQPSAPQELRDSGALGAQRSADTALETAARLSSAAKARAQYSLALQSIIRQVRDDLAGFSGIATRYALPCKDIVEHPDRRFAYWFVEKDKSEPAGIPENQEK